MLPVLGMVVSICWLASLHSMTGRLSAKQTVLLELEAKLPFAFLRRENEEEVELRGLVVTMDAGHARREIQQAIIEQHGGQVLVRIKGNCAQTWQTLTSLHWCTAAERSWQEEHWQRSRNGSWERRTIEVFTPHEKLLPFPHAKQAYRITHSSCKRLGGAQSVSYSYGITSLAAEVASAQQLLALQRGHWQVESGNHYRRDVSLGEDRSRIRTGHGPSNAAALNNLALALLLSQRPQDTVPHAQTYYVGNRDEAVDLILTPR